MPPPPAHAAPGRERPSALQSARKQTGFAEEEARAHPATAPTPPAQVPAGVPAGRLRWAGCRGTGEALGDCARPPPHLPAVCSSRPSRVFLGRILGRVYWKGRSALREFTEANQQSTESQVTAWESVLPRTRACDGSCRPRTLQFLLQSSPSRSPVARDSADPASGLTGAPPRNSYQETEPLLLANQF